MAQLRVIIADHTGAKKTPAELPDDVSMKRLVPALVTKMGLPTQVEGNAITYALDHKRTGKRLLDDDTMAGVGVQLDDVLILLPTITAGLWPEGVHEELDIKIETIPGIDPRTVRDVPLQDLRNSPAALVIVARQYERLTREFKKQSIELEIEKQKSTDRLTATLLLLVSQVVLSIGTNLLTSNQTIPAVAVLVAGALQALLAIYLSFRKSKRPETEKDA